MQRRRFVLAGGLLASLWIACGSGVASSGSGLGTGSYALCTSDVECPANQGCNLDTPKGDGYCTPLCSDNSECPAKYDCPDLTQSKAGDCDDKGDHAGGKGICEQFEGSQGPNTCKTRKKDTAPIADGGSVTD